MGFLKKMFGSKMSKEEFAETALTLQEEWANTWVKYFENDLKLNKDQSAKVGGSIAMESHILALFIITVSIANESIKDIIHDKYIAKHQPVAELIKNTLPMRYEGYNNAFYSYVDDPKKGFLLSDIIMLNIINSTGVDIPNKVIESPKIFSLFMNMFNATLSTIKETKDDRGIEGF